MDKVVSLRRIFLVIVILCFGFDLFHFAYHFHHDPNLFGISAVLQKLWWKIGFFAATFILLSLSRRKLVFLAVLIWSLGWMERPFFGFFFESCESLRDSIKESGIARDAKENFLGRVKITGPRANLPPEIDQVTWWGKFPSLSMSTPKFEARWINPDGQEVARQTFRGEVRALAKTTLRMGQLPGGRLAPGTWRVVVSCKDIVIDNHPFTVYGTPSLELSRDSAFINGAKVD